MVTDSFLALACGGLIVSIFGAMLAFFGYRLFLFLLPIWGFFFGLVLGAQSMQALFGTGFLSEITSWVVGFFVGLIFAVLSYLFYFAAVAIIAGSLGYSLTVGVLLAIGLDPGLLVWLIGIVAAVALAIVTLVFNLQKWVIILATSFAGAAVVFGSFFALFNPFPNLLENPIRAYLDAYPFIAFLALIFAIIGVVFQFQTTKAYQIESYSRWES